MPTYAESVRNKLRALLGTNKVSDIDAGFLALAEDVDKKMASYWEGTHAARPAAGQSNRFYKETDTHLLFHDTGTEWEQLLRAGDQPFPRSWITGTIGAGNVVNNSTQTVTSVRAGALVEWRGGLVFGYNNTVTPGYVARLYRDGVNTVEHDVQVGQVGGDGFAYAAEILPYVESVAGTHTYSVELFATGLPASFATVSGVLTIGP